MEEKDYLGHRDRVRKKYEKGGIDIFEDYEILELLLFYGIPRRDTKDLAHMLIRKFGSLSTALEADVKSLMSVGVTRNTALFLNLITDICRRYYEDRYQNNSKEVNLFDLHGVISSKFIGVRDEKVALLLTDAKGRELYFDYISSGGAKSVNVNINKIISLAVEYKAVYAVLAHNHPSGNPMPSVSDELITKKLIRALNLINVTFWDHLIVTTDETLSIRDTSILNDYIDDIIREDQIVKEQQEKEKKEKTIDNNKAL